MACIVFKAFSYPISNFLNPLNPFRAHRIINQLSERVEDCVNERYNTEREIRDIKKEIGLIKKPAKKRSGRK